MKAAGPWELSAAPRQSQGQMAQRVGCLSTRDGGEPRAPARRHRPRHHAPLGGCGQYWAGPRNCRRCRPRALRGRPARCAAPRLRLGDPLRLGLTRTLKMFTALLRGLGRTRLGWAQRGGRHRRLRGRGRGAPVAAPCADVCGRLPGMELRRQRVVVARLRRMTGCGAFPSMGRAGFVPLAAQLVGRVPVLGVNAELHW